MNLVNLFNFKFGFKFTNHNNAATTTNFTLSTRSAACTPNSVLFVWRTTPLWGPLAVCSNDFCRLSISFASRATNVQFQGGNFDATISYGKLPLHKLRNVSSNPGRRQQGQG